MYNLSPAIIVTNFFTPRKCARHGGISLSAQRQTSAHTADTAAIYRQHRRRITAASTLQTPSPHHRGTAAFQTASAHPRGTATLQTTIAEPADAARPLVRRVFHPFPQLFLPAPLLFHSVYPIMVFAVEHECMRPWSNGYDAGLRSLRSRFDSWRARHTAQLAASPPGSSRFFAPLV